MLTFWIVAALMLLAAVWFILPAFLGKAKLRNADRNEQNISIAKERLLELDQEFKNGVLDEDLYQQQKTECQKSLVTDVTEAEASLDVTASSKVQVLVSLFIIPLIALPLYLSLGNPSAFDESLQRSAATSGGHEKQNMVSMEEALSSLAAKLEQDPTNIKGWQMLARSYMSVRRFEAAADAYGRLYQLVGEQADVMLSYADALSMSRGGRLTGKPFELIKKALQQSPNNITALWLAGLAYSEAAEYQTAIQYWQRLLPMLQTDEASQDKIRTLIAQAEQKLGRPVAVNKTSAKEVTNNAVTKPASLSVTVSLAESFKAQVKPDDVVFIYAKANQGPPMPLAAVRKRAGDLPVTVILDDSMAMMPQMKLSSFSVVNVGARISKSGSPTGQSGDLQGTIELVTVAAGSNVNVVINTIK